MSEFETGTIAYRIFDSGKRRHDLVVLQEQHKREIGQAQMEKARWMLYDAPPLSPAVACDVEVIKVIKDSGSHN